MTFNITSVSLIEPSFISIHCDITFSTHGRQIVSVHAEQDWAQYRALCDTSTRLDW